MTDRGYYFKTDRELPAIIVVNKTDQGCIHEDILAPTWDKVEQICEKYEVSFLAVEKLIEGMKPGTHTIMFDIQKFRDYLKEIEP